MNGSCAPGNVLPVRTAASLIVLPLTLVLAAACGGKVTFVTGSTGTGGEGGGASTTAAGTTGTGSGLKTCLPELVGGGPLGPPTITGSKCFGWDEGKLCPETVVAGAYIPVDSCYLLESVDAPCAPADSGECCYDVTETLYCK